MVVVGWMDDTDCTGAGIEREREKERERDFLTVSPSEIWNSSSNVLLFLVPPKTSVTARFKNSQVQY